MRGAAARLAALGLVAATAALCAVSCAALIGVEAPEDVAMELCDCESAETYAPNCEKALPQILKEDKERAKDWLEGYEDNCKCGSPEDLRRCLRHPLFCDCRATPPSGSLDNGACALICTP